MPVASRFSWLFVAGDPRPATSRSLTIRFSNIRTDRQYGRQFEGLGGCVRLVPNRVRDTVYRRPWSWTIGLEPNRWTRIGNWSWTCQIARCGNWRLRESEPGWRKRSIRADSRSSDQTHDVAGERAVRSSPSPPPPARACRPAKFGGNHGAGNAGTGDHRVTVGVCRDRFEVGFQRTCRLGFIRRAPCNLNDGNDAYDPGILGSPKC